MAKTTVVSTIGGSTLRRGMLAAGCAAIAAATLAGCATSEAQSAMPVTIHDALKPSAEILISAPCASGDTRATVETSFGEKVEMSPAADMGELIAYITAPENIGPGPENGYHTATVTCASGESATVTFPESGNGSPQDHPEPDASEAPEGDAA